MFLFHAWSAMPEIEQSDQPGYLLAKVSSVGHLGVVIFNIVTGLVLSLPHLGPKKADVPNYLAFLRRRFLRILPHYWIALIFWTLLLLGPSSPLHGLCIPFLAHLFLVHTLSPATFFSIVPAYWWLGLLAQFYLIFPFLLRLFRRWGATRCLLVTSLVCWGGWFIVRQLSFHEPGGCWLSSITCFISIFHQGFLNSQPACGLPRRVRTSGSQLKLRGTGLPMDHASRESSFSSGPLS